MSEAVSKIPKQVVRPRKIAGPIRRSLHQLRKHLTVGDFAGPQKAAILQQVHRVAWANIALPAVNDITTRGPPTAFQSNRAGRSRCTREMPCPCSSAPIRTERSLVESAGKNDREVRPIRACRKLSISNVGHAFQFLREIGALVPQTKSPRKESTGTKSKSHRFAFDPFTIHAMNDQARDSNERRHRKTVPMPCPRVFRFRNRSPIRAVQTGVSRDTS